jgi:UDP-N-acetylmuramoyl-tripeptide--D-alanyl-D-alanine ligase
VLAAVAFHAAVRLRHELQMMQQNSYRAERYGRWLRGDIFAPERVTDLLMLGVATGFSATRWGLYAVGAVGLLALYKAVRELRTKYKKPLVFTPRATRLYVVALVLTAAALAGVFLGAGVRMSTLAAMGAVVLAPVILCVALMLLMPVEAAVNRWYVNDARRILRSMPRLTVIGITGSYGKTSTKNYLYRILSERFSVVMTPASYNTTLGVVRTVREQLKPYTEVFIVEMGAKQAGDIAEICELVQPTIGIITAVGEQHLESFGSIENVQRTKFELIDALPADGVAILNDDFEPIASRPVTNVSRVMRYTSRDVDPAPFETRLVGRHNLTNIYAAWLAGRALGMSDSEMRYAVGQIEQVEHRLSIRRTAGGVTIIDDAFNSNPVGAAMAMEVLAGFGGATGAADGRRIVVTPGMIELGARQEELNRELGRQMAAACDIAVVVGEHNREAIVAGLSDGGFDAGAIHTAATFADASAWLGGVLRAGDTVLYENDLPDTFK